MMPPPPSDPTNREIPSRVTCSDDEFESVREGLRCFLKSRLSQEVDVEDCLQSVSVKWLQHRERLPSHATRAWLFTVAANEAALWWRKTSRANKALRSLANQATNVAETDEQFNRIDRHETAELVRQAVERLPTDMQMVLKRRMEFNTTFEQIASELGIPLGTALSRMNRALARLELELKKTLGPPPS